MSEAVSRDDSPVKIERLLDHFYGQTSLQPGPSQLGDFASVEKVPPPFDQLLDHDEHMTVTVESFFNDVVDVDVHRTLRDGKWYAREITLSTRQSKRIVQYGIVRLNVEALDDQVWRQIESQETPLGRVLIEHNVLREVQLCELWEIQAGQCLSSLLHIKLGDKLYGRTALIYCDGEPAIELLEVIAPVHDS